MHVRVFMCALGVCLCVHVCVCMRVTQETHSKMMPSDLTSNRYAVAKLVLIYNR